MEYIALYKYNYRKYNNIGEPIGPELEFNFFDSMRGFEHETRLKCVDSIKITDVLDYAISGIDWGLRKDNDIKKIDMGRFGIVLDIDNEALSEEEKTLDEFLATSELSYRQIYVVFQYGPDIAYEGWLDRKSILRDRTWAEKKWDISFEVDGPGERFYESMRDQMLPKVPESGNITFLTYFRDYHFGYYFNNGSVTSYVDEVKLADKLRWSEEAPVISNPLQRSFLNSDMSVFDGTKSFAMMGFVFTIKSIRPNGYEADHILPFEMTISLEGDAAETVRVDDISVHQQGYDWNANQHFILPYWKLSGNPTQTEAYYFGLFMSANAVTIANHDYPFGSTTVLPIRLYNAGARNGLYEVTGLYYARKRDTYLLDVEYREQGLFNHVVEGEQFGVQLAYFRILVKTWWKDPSSLQYRDMGFEDIINVTAKNVYQYMCGQFKERRFLNIPYEPDTKIKPGTLIESTEFDGTVKVDRFKKLDIKKQSADVEVIQV